MNKRNTHNPRYQIDESRNVEVYRNLHKECFSIKQDGIVKAHARHIYLQDVAFKVNEAGRQRVLREKRKNVHAVLVGKLAKISDQMEIVSEFDVTYNPYKYNSFVEVETEMPVKKACEVMLNFLGNRPWMSVVETRNVSYWSMTVARQQNWARKNLQL